MGDRILEERRLQAVLANIDMKFLEVARLIRNGQHDEALQVIHQMEINLTRIRTLLTIETDTTINQSLHDIRILCEEHLQNADVENRLAGATSSSNAYSAPRIYSGRAGRPKLDISKDQLEFLMQENYTAQKMSSLFGCSTGIIYKKCYEYGLKFRKKYYTGTEEGLYEEIRDLHSQFPNSGSQMMIGYLRSRGKYVQRKKVRDILADIDPLGTASRWSSAIHRRTYSVPTPNSLWHMDAHLKLIRWKFAIHGCIDGYSRLILYLKCNNSMTAGSVIPYFAAAAAEYGLPSRVRSDHGYENFFVALLMNALRGFERGSHLTGQSVHNQRIERLWVDVFTQVVDYFYREFNYLEKRNLLDIENNHHMFALHKVYVGSINRKLETFEKAWNRHSIRTVGKTPRQLWISGMLTNINSSYTATNEIFQVQDDIYTRVLQAFEVDEMDLNIINADEHITPSNLNIQLALTENISNQVERILLLDVTDEDKYIQILNCLNN